MNNKINFVFGIHNHQPIGNFDYVFDEAYEKSYIRVLECLEKHPSVKLTLHNTGPLWDYYFESRPEYIDKVRRLVKSGQLEMLSGAYYEPILINISDRDKMGQIKKMNRLLRREIGKKPKGMWLAERVWEPHLAKPIALSDISYTILDEYHFRSSGLEEKDIFGYYVTEEQGYPLLVVPINYHLRQSIPVTPPEEIIDYLKKWSSQGENLLAVFADDGEKFGLWPKSFKQVWENQWMDKFFTLLEENSHWITSVTPSEYIENNPPMGRVYLPTASYFEMSGWTLPPRSAGKYYELAESIKQSGEWDQLRNFLKGGFWRNYLMKYPESNRIQKKALYISEKVNAMQTGAKDEALNELYMGQCNCAYWHGVFGGIYLPHLRHGIQEHLINASTIADDEKHRGEPFKEIISLDINRDMKDEVIINTQNIELAFIPHKGGSLYELNYKTAGINFCDTFTRKPEYYHRNLQPASSVETNTEETSLEEIEEITSPLVKKISKDQIFYDEYDRHSFIDHIYTDEPDFNKASAKGFTKMTGAGDFPHTPYDVFISTKDDKAILTLSCKKNIVTNEGELQTEIEKTFFVPESGESFKVQYWLINDSDMPMKIYFGSEMNFSFHGCNIEQNYAYQEKTIEEKNETRVETLIFPLDGAIEHKDIENISLQDGNRKARIHLGFGETAEKVWQFPIETISQSEAGIEMVYQSTGIMPLWNITLEPGDSWENYLEISLEDAGDLEKENEDPANDDNQE